MKTKEDGYVIRVCCWSLGALCVKGASWNRPIVGGISGLFPLSKSSIVSIWTFRYSCFQTGDMYRTVVLASLIISLVGCSKLRNPPMAAFCLDTTSLSHGYVAHIPGRS